MTLELSGGTRGNMMEEQTEQTQQTQQAQPVKITFTYESLFDMVVREKSKEELQQLNQNFFTELVNYLNEKKSAISLISSEEREKANRQLLNINRLVKELYERREKKILGLALARSRAGVDIIDTSALLAEEKALFDGIVRQLDVFREGVLNSLLVAKSPKHMAEAAEMATEKASWQNPYGQHRSAVADRAILPLQDLHPQQQREAAASAAEEARSDQNPTRLVRFLHAVPRFVGRELEVYGPFDQEDIANLPREIAEVLIAKGRAEEMAQA
ncbi:hypothetical protein HYY73_06070 [Candidatus Woesearchaeota archaeon]|nr:hypothetical protein [Candidatus Woesearchaeota archaeon]